MADTAPAPEIPSNADPVKPQNGTTVEKVTNDAVKPPNEENGDAKSRSVLAQQRADENAKKIAAQIENYLGDFNLTVDKFFRDLAQKDEGWVPIETIMKCNRVKKYTSNPVDIIPSLQKFSTMFDLDDAGQRIKRIKAFSGDSDEARADRDARTVHVKRIFKTATMDAMQDYFSKFGRVEGIILNKFQEGDPKLRGKFKGSVSCIFSNKAEAEKYLAGSEEETKFDGREMMRAWKKDHTEEREQRLIEKKEQIEKSKIPGSVLHISTQRAIDYIKVKDFFSQRQPVEYVDSQRGQREARVRFKEGVAKEVLENILAHNNNKVIIEGTQYKARVLEGKEEATYFATYWDTFLEARNNRILRNMRNDPKGQFKYQPAKSADKPDTPAKKKVEDAVNAEDTGKVEKTKSGEVGDLELETPSDGDRKRKPETEDEPAEPKKAKVDEVEAQLGTA